jgi:glutamyl-Q tRNA(Asp) synthetase
MARALDRARTILAGDPLTFVELDTDGHGQVVTAHPERWGDAVIVRKDTPASYHLAVVIDDAEQQITHVTRGRDLYAATDIHRLLQVLLGLPEPLYHHHRLVADETGRKLSKSARDTALRALREAGVAPAEIRQQLRLPATPAS